MNMVLRIIRSIKHDQTGMVSAPSTVVLLLFSITLDSVLYSKVQIQRLFTITEMMLRRASADRAGSSSDTVCLSGRNEQYTEFPV